MSMLKQLGRITGGVTCRCLFTFHMYPGAYHGFYRVPNARVIKQAERDTREALRRFLHG